MTCQGNFKIKRRKSYSVKYLHTRNEEAHKAVKQAIDMPERTTTKLSYIDHQTTWPSGWLETAIGKDNRKTALANHTTLYHTLKSERVPKTAVGNMSLGLVASVLDRLN